MEPPARPAGILANGRGGIAARLVELPADRLVLAAIVLFAFALRSWNVNWDASQHLHPDERFVSTVLADLRGPDSLGDYFDSEDSDLNPYNHRASYVYGTLPLFATKAAAEWLDRDSDGSTHRTGRWVLAASTAVGAGTERADGSLVFDGGYNANLVGRVLSALVDTLTVLLVFEFGRYLSGRAVGLVAAFVLALAPLHIQLSHFSTTETFLTFFSTATLYLLVRAGRERKVALFAAAGAAGGAALACKVSAILLLGPLAAMLLVAAVPAIRQSLAERAGSFELAKIAAYWAGAALLSLALGLLMFRVFQPYAFSGDGFLGTFTFDFARSDFSPSAMLHLEPLKPRHILALDERFLRDLANLRITQEGADFPPNMQWIDRHPLFWPLQNLVLWGFGPFASLAAAAGIGAIAWRRELRTHPAAWLLVGWCLLVFAYYGLEFITTMRYYLPIYPALAVLAGLGLHALWTVRLPRTPRWRFLPEVAPAAAAALLSGGIAVAGLGFTRGVYGEEVSRIQASRWMLNELPHDSVISHENWDDGLPMQPPGFPPNPFTTINLDLYGTDSRPKMLALADRLDELDVIVQSSTRLSESIPRHPARHPGMTRYYEALEDGSLGFEQVAEFSNPPSLFGIEIDDSSAEEAFTVYDHPTVKIYRKTPAYSRERALAVLQPDRADAAIGAEPGDADTNSLLLTPSAYRAQQEGGTWSQVFNPNGWASSAAWLWWFLWLEIAAFAAVPWVTWLCRWLPDRGFGFSKLAGPAAVMLVAWLAVAWDVADFSRTLAWSAFGLIAVAGAATAFVRMGALREEARRHWPAWLATEVAFIAVFGAFLALRAWNPDLWYHPTGGEKPMEVAYLTAVVRSTEMPPYDPWFAGGALNYYYLGWFFLAVPIRAFQLVPEVAFNLAVPTFAAISAALAFSAGYNCILLSRIARERATRRGICGGAAAAFLLVLAGNLDAAHQTIERLQRMSSASPHTGFGPTDGALRLLSGFWQWVSTDEAPVPFDWWRSSRVHFGGNDITEFPYWSYLFGDVHPHLMGIPFFLSVCLLCIAYVAASQNNDRPRSMAIAVTLGVALALVRMVHTWDFPTAMVLVAVTVALGQLVATGSLRSRTLSGVLHLALAGGVAQLISSPYLDHSSVFNRGVVRSAQTTEPQQFLAHFGIFILLAAAYVGIRYYEAAREGLNNPLVNLLATPGRALAALTLVVCLALFSNEQGYMVIAMGSVSAVLLANLLWMDLRARAIGEIAVSAFLLAGFSIAVAVDIVTVKADIGRMNTVFKFSLQAWHLLAIGCSFAAVYVLVFLVTPAASPPSIRSRLSRSLAMRGLAVVFVLAALFPVMATPVRQDARFGDFGPTLDGLKYLDADPTFTEDVGRPGPDDDSPLHLAEDEPLIRWLRANVRGTPTIVEAVGPLYHWTGRYSINTGLPAVVGWDWHQVQQRGLFSGPVATRRAETRDFYASDDAGAAERYLRRYDVSYVIVGPWERAFGTPEGISKFDGMEALDRVFTLGDNRIYRVERTLLGPGGESHVESVTDR